MTIIRVGGREVQLTNLEKVFWPEGITKGDLIAHYSDVGLYAIKYLDGRPVVMSRYPDGISGKTFYQKECPETAPEWVETVPVLHDNGTRTVNYVVYRGVETLVWLANLGCIAMHSWISRRGTLERPDVAVIDLDPSEGVAFSDVVTVAKLVHTALQEFGLTGFPKTSGATGLHVFIPIQPRWSFREVTLAMKVVAQLVTRICPFATIERVIRKRAGKVYIDYLQNAFGKAMAFPYSVRPYPAAPVSTPLRWDELDKPSLAPLDFNIRTIGSRLQTMGDLYEGFFHHQGSLNDLLELAGHDRSEAVAVR